ncbi:ABC transporter ATP-binding protein [Hyphococcus luteus]|uniref:ABC transporter ATP-binding protein n=1 Tax=Hyphococcus luteus TaxID=2058213 RepID=A0A2S7K6C5_9PROT|nr:ATP-binding cassette domain-containing protein [Marinicaulis flavus]PQA88047.1 ABC transporter ATP-binding protein [Marinicaulis flavus]
MTDHPVQLENITKRYGAFTAVKDLTFSVAKGEIYGFLGPNGAGKTTTLRMMLDIVRPSEGRICVLGSNSAISVRRRIGYLPEERGLYRKMKAAQSIAYFAQLRGLSGRDAKKKAYALLEEFGLEDFARSKNEALSKGMAQKVQLLATIAHEPELLILDEPFSGLDPINQQTLEKLIADQRASGRTIIFSTHVMQHAERLCDRFLIIAEGEKRFEGTLSEARARYGQRLHVRSTAPAAAFEVLPGVEAVRLERNGGEESDYRIELADGADPQDFLRQAVAAGIVLTRFEQAGATLHDIFVDLAGDEASAPAHDQERAFARGAEAAE